MHIQKTISYYQDCYKNEFRDNDVLNIFGTKVDKRFFLKEIHQLYREEDSIFMQTDFGEELYKYLEIHKKEKTFIAGSFFITGKLTFLGKKQTICAPLIVTPVTLEINKEALYHIAYNFEENRTNDALLNILKNNYNLDDSFVVDIKSALTSDAPEHLDIKNILDKLKSYIPELKLNGLEELPALMSNADLRKNTKAATLQCTPAIALGIVEKSKSSRAVLHEIDEIKEGHLFNDTLTHLFSKRKIEVAPFSKDKEAIYVPSNLSEAQLEIIKAVRANDLTVVIGPPGTGKSYTIASLALDLVYHNKSVLICSKSDQAVDVIQHKIVKDLGVKGLSIRAGAGRSHRAKLRKKIEAVSKFRGVKGGDFYIPQKQREIDQAKWKIKEITEEIASREEVEIKKTELFLDPKPSFLKRWKRNYATKKVLKEYPFWKLIDLLQHYIHQKNKLIKEIIVLRYEEAVWNLTQKDRTFPQLLRLIKAKDPLERERLFQSIDFPSLLKCLPIWITKATDMSELFPLENDIFDVVIIDEASQCDIATMIPVLARAKKVVVVGDPKQLRHVSFLSKEIMEKTANTNGVLLHEEVFDYRETSLLDFAMERLPSQSNVHFLDEHYRSVPNIIRYSNQKFYFDRLKVMSDLQIHHKETAIQWISCNGEKQKNGVNLAEANQILKDIKALVAQESNVSVEMATRIGILSPFRDQVNHLKKALEKFDLAAIRKHHIAVGTPFEFQGEERDFMYLSFTIDNQTSASIFQYLDREDVFNVSVTRAKQKQLLYYSFDPKNFKNKHLLIEYYAETNINYSRAVHTSTYMDQFATEVYEELVQLGIPEEDILVNYPLANYIMDILVTFNNKTICIDLVGFPGEFEKTFSMEQYKTLFRTQVPIVTIPYAYWLFHKEACIAHIKKKGRITT